MAENHKRKGEISLRHDVVKQDLNKGQAIATLDCRDLTIFKDAIKKRANVEEAKVKKVQQHLEVLRKTLLVEQRKRDEAKKQWLVSSK